MISATSAATGAGAGGNSSPSSSPMVMMMNSDEKEIFSALQHFSFLQACSHCDLRIIDRYVKTGVSPDIANIRDPSGKTGLNIACTEGFASVVTKLSKLKTVDVNLSDVEGNTPLIAAAQSGHSDVVKSLLKLYRGRININQQNSMGCTALIKSAIQGRSECAKLLVMAGASLKMRDYSRSMTAVEWAEFCGRHDWIREMEEVRRGGKYVFKRFGVKVKNLLTSSSSGSTSGSTGGGRVAVGVAAATSGVAATVSSSNLESTTTGHNRSGSMANRSSTTNDDNPVRKTQSFSAVPSQTRPEWAIPQVRVSLHN